MISILKNNLKGQLTTIGAILITALTMLGSVVSARITAVAQIDKQSIGQDKRIISLENNVASVNASLGSIQNDVKIIKCAVIGRNSPEIFNECKNLNQ